MIVAIFIGSIILLILLCGVVVSTKAISKRGRNDQSDAVYRDNYRYRNQYREEKDDFVSIESSSPEEQTTESAENNVEEEFDYNELVNMLNVFLSELSQDKRKIFLEVEVSEDEYQAFMKQTK